MWCCTVLCPLICPLSRKLAVASWSYSRFSKGRGRSESNTVIFPPLPPSSRGIFGAVFTGSNPARSLGNLYSAYPTSIKIPSCFQAHMNLSFRSPPPWASSIWEFLSIMNDANQLIVVSFRTFPATGFTKYVGKKSSS